MRQSPPSTAVLGEPDDDSGWVEPLTIGACAGTEARFVGRGARCTLYFSDESAVGHGGALLRLLVRRASVTSRPIPEGLATPEGIGLGTTRRVPPRRLP